MGTQSNNDRDFQIEIDIFESILNNIKMYKDVIAQREDFIKAQFGLNFTGIINIATGNNKPILLYATKNLISATKKNLEKIVSALDSEKLTTMSGIRQLQRLIGRSIEDIDEQYKRVLYNNEKPEEIVGEFIWNYCKDCVIEFMRFVVDLIKNAYDYFTYHNSISDKNEKLLGALSKNNSALFTTSLARQFKNEQESLRKQINKMRTFEEDIVQRESDITNGKRVNT